MIDAALAFLAVLATLVVLAALIGVRVALVRTVLTVVRGNTTKEAPRG